MSEGYVYDVTICCSAECAADLVPKIILATQQKIRDRNLYGMRPDLMHLVPCALTQAMCRQAPNVCPLMQPGNVHGFTQGHMHGRSRVVTIDALNVSCRRNH